MPPLIAFAGALGALAVVRWAYRTALRVNRELEEARLARVAEAAAEPTDIPTLRRDPNHRRLSPGLILVLRAQAWPACLDSSLPRRYGPARLACPSAKT